MIMIQVQLSYYDSNTIMHIAVLFLGYNGWVDYPSIHCTPRIKQQQLCMIVQVCCALVNIPHGYLREHNILEQFYLSLYQHLLMHQKKVIHRSSRKIHQKIFISKLFTVIFFFTGNRRKFLQVNFVIVIVNVIFRQGVHSVN